MEKSDLEKMDKIELQIRLEMAIKDIAELEKEKEELRKQLLDLQLKIQNHGRKNKFNALDEKQIKEMHKNGVSITQIAKDYNTSRVTIYKILDVKK